MQLYSSTDISASVPALKKRPPLVAAFGMHTHNCCILWDI